ncbi:DNA-processing protein DprA [Yoonia sediminilitoris]|uniref:DNA protecting protein DprA n=1 Tax=Yoonia sediminilitoris TaxID=1286148 RepID=A0A2T6KK21_9RHOB|nr:DNA-processing protein DprA [Yoonia sediminilitoris]PUB16308.1 DNA protecting protein DprA [Yoonia sediminilitoris]RCW96657.1 DNA protecting protein DprA [Yoonia sediminilitoris]
MAGTQQSSTHPPLLPTTEEDTVNRLRLLRSRRVGVATYRRLMAEHGSAANALGALPEVAKSAGVQGYQSCPHAVVIAELNAGRTAGAKLLVEGGTDYPSDLADIPDAPPLLWSLGRTDLLRRPLIALVGARNASSLGTRMAKRLAEELTEEGFVIVSGLARGIDAAAHLGALAGGTIAVQAGGVDVIYPAENAQLAEKIAETGLRLSEMPMGMQPQARHFPARNRIISGLCRAVVVVEAAAKSGSLITARNALDQARDVLAVPGHPFDARATGCNMLIRDGAILVRNARDVIEAIAPLAPTAKELPLVSPEKSSPNLAQTAKLHDVILSRLGPAPVAEDQLMRDVAAPASKITSVLVDLELEGKIARQAGGLLSRVI